jgi:hypothetical protein
MSHPLNFTLNDIKLHLREGQFTSLGGYPKFFVGFDGSVLSFDWVRDNWKEVCHDYISCDDEKIVGVDINWEDPNLYCDGSNERIPSAYAD